MRFSYQRSSLSRERNMKLSKQHLGSSPLPSPAPPPPPPKKNKNKTNHDSFLVTFPFKGQEKGYRAAKQATHTHTPHTPTYQPAPAAPRALPAPCPRRGAARRPTPRSGGGRSLGATDPTGRPRHKRRVPNPPRASKFRVGSWRLKPRCFLEEGALGPAGCLVLAGPIALWGAPGNHGKGCAELVRPVMPSKPN